MLSEKGQETKRKRKTFRDVEHDEEEGIRNTEQKIGMQIKSTVISSPTLTSLTSDT